MNSIFDKLKEAQQPAAPMLNLSTINKNTLPQVTQGLNNIVKTQDQLRQQQQALIAQGQQPGQQPGQANTLGTTIHEEGGDYPGSIDGTGESNAYDPKTLPANGTPTMGSSGEDFKAMGMKDMAADTMPILEDEPEEIEEPVQRYEIEDHINELLESLFGFKYYFGKDYEQLRAPKPDVVQKKDIQGRLFPQQQQQSKVIPYFDKLNGGEKERLMSDPGFAQIMKLLDFDKYPDALNALIRYNEKTMQENFVKSDTFRIIAENEAPRISKGDLINYIKTRKI
jgi:hypothetical protein